MKERVIFDSVEKDLVKLPRYVVDKLIAWALDVELKGLRDVRRIPGYHDEPLKGRRSGQRSIRLTKAYRAIYREETDSNMIILIQVSKHEY